MPKKMLVIGGTGLTGRAVLNRALKDEDIEITALVRSTTRLPKEIQDKIRLVIGDIFNAEDVDKAMQDQDVVVSCLGKRLLDTGDANVYSKGMEVIIEAMRRHSIKYLHFVGISFFLPGYTNLPSWMHPTLRESRKMYDYIKKVDDIVWVATMAPNISVKGGLTNNYQVKVDKLPGGTNVTKDDLADWLVTSVLDPDKMEEHKHKMLGISTMGTTRVSNTMFDYYRALSFLL